MYNKEKRKFPIKHILTPDPPHNTEGDWLSQEDNRVIGLDRY